jgi:hypothetical protein
MTTAPYTTAMLIKNRCPVNQFQISVHIMDLSEIKKKAENGWVSYAEVIYLKKLYELR